MPKTINPPKRQKKLDFLVIASVLILASLTIFPAAASIDSHEYSHSAETGTSPGQVSAEFQGDAGSPIPAFTPYEDPKVIRDIDQYIDVTYMLGGIGAAVLICLIYPLINRRVDRFITDFPELPHPSKIRKLIGVEDADLDRIKTQRVRLFTAIPVLCIALAELLIFFGFLIICALLLFERERLTLGFVTFFCALDYRTM